jgi:hypothetical protein
MTQNIPGEYEPPRIRIVEGSETRTRRHNQKTRPEALEHGSDRSEGNAKRKEGVWGI